MEKLNKDKIRELCQTRHWLALKLREAADVWRLSASAENLQSMGNMVLLVARYEGAKGGAFKILLSTTGKSSKGEATDVLRMWDIAPEDLAALPRNGFYVSIEKHLLGRPKREFTLDERQTIMEMREAGESIRSIARALKTSNQRIIKHLKTYRIGKG